MVELPPIDLSGIISVSIDWLISASAFAAILIVGYIVAKIVEKLLRGISKTFEIEERIREAGLEDALLGFTLTDIVVILTDIYILLLFTAIASSVVNLSVLESWALSALDYMQSAVQGIALLVIGLFVADYIGDKIKSSHVLGANMLGILVEVFIAYNAIVIALPALMPSVDTDLLKLSFLAIISILALSLSIGLGLAIGLGMKDTVARISKKHEKSLESIFK